MSLITSVYFMTKHIHHVNDGLFKEAMTNLKMAKDLLKAHLPARLVKHIDWDTLQITNKSYVDEKPEANLL